MHIVLFQPEIPSNTGNISRTCAVTGFVLHLVRPLGFSTDDKHLKRAGLDYWKSLDIRYHDSIEEVWEKHPNSAFYYIETQGTKSYTDVQYQPDDFIVFGRETKGLPQYVLDANRERVVRIPMRAGERSLNLSNTVAIVAYEALRQQRFPGLK